LRNIWQLIRDEIGQSKKCLQDDAVLVALGTTIGQTENRQERDREVNQ
jgi:hypothetical protein